MSWIKTFQGFATVGMLSAMLVIGSWVRSIDDHAKEAPTQADIAVFTESMKSLKEKFGDTPSKADLAELKALAEETRKDLNDNWTQTLINARRYPEFQHFKGWVEGRLGAQEQILIGTDYDN